MEEEWNPPNLASHTRTSPCGGMRHQDTVEGITLSSEFHFPISLVLILGLSDDLSYWMFDFNYAPPHEIIGSFLSYLLSSLRLHRIIRPMFVATHIPSNAKFAMKGAGLSVFHASSYMIPPQTHPINARGQCE